MSGSTNFDIFSEWVGPSTAARNHIDFVSYLYNNFPDRRRSKEELDAFTAYQSTVHEIAAAEDALITLRANLVRLQIRKEAASTSETRGDPYATINQNIINAGERVANAALRQFEKAHLLLRIRKAHLEAQVLEGESLAVQKRAEVHPASLSYNSSSPVPICLPCVETKSPLSAMFAAVNAEKLSRALSYAPQAVDAKERAPSVSHSISTPSTAPSHAVPG